MTTARQVHETAVALARAATQGSQADCERWTAWLRARPGREWLALDEESRSWRVKGQAPVSGTRGWLGERLDEPTGLVAVVTSWHADGRFRQRATQVLAARRGVLAAGGLAVRALDHVPPVRADAVAGLRRCTSREEAAAAFAVLAAGSQRQFAAEALQEYSHAVAQRADLTQLLADLRRADDPVLRRWAFGHSQERGLIGVEELLSTELRGTDQYLRGTAAQQLRGRATTPQLLALLEGRFVDGRLLALQDLPEEALDDEALLPLLADRSGRVREMAQWRARRRGHDLAGWYRGQLRDEHLGPARLAACLSGLSDIGTPEDARLLAGFLDHASPQVRARSVLAIGALAPAAAVRTALMPLLLDSAPKVSAAAARVLGRAGATAADAEPAWLSTAAATRRAAWRLSRTSGSWARVDADLRAAVDEDAVLSGLGRAGVRNWLQAGAASTWGRPSSETARRIQELLPGAGLTDDEQRQVSFHAGLPAAPVARAADGVDSGRRGLRLLRRR